LPPENDKATMKEAGRVLVNADDEAWFDAIMKFLFLD
jgi:hypothetical protein